MAGSVDIASDISGTGRMTKLKFLFTEKNKGKGGTGDTEPSLTLVIRHIFGFSYRLGTSPSTVQFEDQKGKYFLISPAWRKVCLDLNFTIDNCNYHAENCAEFQVLCLAMLILSNLHYEALNMLAPPKAGIAKGETAMLKFLAISYNCFYFAFYWTLFKEGSKLLGILNGVLNTSRKIRQRDTSSLSRMKVNEHVAACRALAGLRILTFSYADPGALFGSSYLMPYHGIQ